MSWNFEKNEKRSRSNSNEANNSFVKNVTSRVTGMLPATIVKWFSSPSTSSNDAHTSNGLVMAGDATDSSTEDEAPESPVTIQPPAKRMRLSPPAKFQHFGPNDTSVSNMEALEPITPYNNNRQSTLRPEFNSNYLELQISKSDAPQESVEKISDNAFKASHSISTASLGAGSRKRKSLISPSHTEVKLKGIEKAAANASSDLTMPSFKPCLLGSPFYSGRTMYGGAAASYINQSNVKQQKPTIVNETTNRNNTISHSALRVMDLLEQYSSPLSEAKRIPIVSPNRCRENILSRLETMAQQQQSSKSLTYKTQELHVPSIASILHLKQRSRLGNTTNVARQILASHSSTSDQPYVSIGNHKRSSPSKESFTSSQNYTSKIKSRLTRTRRGHVSEEITAEPVNLPSATLQIDQSKLQSFSFGISTASSQTSTPIVTKPVQAYPKIAECTPTTANETLYQFSIPAKVSPSSHVNIKSPDPDNRANFKFVSPERSGMFNENEQNTNILATNEKNKVASSKLKDWKCGDCWVYNKAEIEKCVCCGGKKPSTNEVKLKCTVCKVSEKQLNRDKCVDCDKTSAVNNDYAKIKENNTSKWKCDDCWVLNDAIAEKCLCCGGAKPGLKNTSLPQKGKKGQAVAVPKAIAAAVPKAIAATIDEDWRCDDCWIKNKSSVEKCVACGNAKPISKQTDSTSTNSTAVPKASDNTFKGLLKSQSDKWECPNCLVGNDKDRPKCVCCDSAKPGTKKEPEKDTFNFDMKTNATFKFGIDPKLQQNNFSKLIENKSSEVSSKEAESEKNNNVLPKTPSFTFGLPTNKIDDKLKQDQVKAVPTVGFTFGVPKSLNSDSTPAPASTFTFTNKVSKPESNKTTDTERPQEVPKIDFVSPVSSLNTQNKDLQKTPTLFSMPVKTSQLKVKNAQQLVFGGAPISATPSAGAPSSGAPITGAPTPEEPTTGTPIASEKKDSPVSTSISSVAAKSVTTFTFSGSSAKPAPLFGTAGPPTLFGDNSASSTNAPFPKETTSTSAAAPTANAPLFNFGSTADKPKFNFTFSGQSKSDAPPLMFGSAKPDAPAPLFGNTKTEQPAPVFGNPKTDAPATMFNNTKSDTQPSLFGNTQTDNPPPSLFGTSKDAPAPLFANTKTETVKLFTNMKPETAKLFGTPGKSDAPLFGSATKTETPLFGSNTKTTPSLFGNTSKSETPLFGNTTKTDAPLFGNAPNAPEPVLFGNTNKVEPSMFKFSGSTETSTGGNKFGSNMFGGTPNDTPSFGSPQSGAPQPASTMFAAPKPASFSFGSTPVFGATSPSFGASEPAQMFGATNSTPSNNIFGASAPTVPGSGMFGSPRPVGTSNFGTPNTSIPPFEASSLTPAPPPAFNFGAAQNTGVFGFGQLQSAQSAGGAAAPGAVGGGGVYTFGGGAGAGSLQFSMGAGAAPPGVGGAGQPPRRVRKVARRNLPR